MIICSNIHKCFSKTLQKFATKYLIKRLHENELQDDRGKDIVSWSMEYCKYTAWEKLKGHMKICACNKSKKILLQWCSLEIKKMILADAP